MLPLKDLFEKVAARQFEPADARLFIKYSYYFANTHPDVHIVLNIRRSPDFHFEHVSEYASRDFHTMFQSMDDAAAGIAGALNSKAGEAALRFIGVTAVRQVAIHSRSAARLVPQVTLRTVTPGAGPHYETAAAPVITLVLGIHDGEVVLTTAYPLLMPRDRPLPPNGFDMVEVMKQFFLYATP
jgi:hypothetical protein